jgi:hypothetical protein
MVMPILFITTLILFIVTLAAAIACLKNARCCYRSWKIEKLNGNTMSFEKLKQKMSPYMANKKDPPRQTTIAEVNRFADTIYINNLRRVGDVEANRMRQLFIDRNKLFLK